MAPLIHLEDIKKVLPTKSKRTRSGIHLELQKGE